MWILGVNGLNIRRSLSGPQRKCKDSLSQGHKKLSVIIIRGVRIKQVSIKWAFTVIISSL